MFAIAILSKKSCCFWRNLVVTAKKFLNDFGTALKTLQGDGR
jgi:hypothetical protein